MKPACSALDGLSLDEVRQHVFPGPAGRAACSPVVVVLTLLFAWVSGGFYTAVMGFVTLMRGDLGGVALGIERAVGVLAFSLTFGTLILRGNRPR